MADPLAGIIAQVDRDGKQVTNFTNIAAEAGENGLLRISHPQLHAWAHPTLAPHG